MAKWMLVLSDRTRVSVAASQVSYTLQASVLWFVVLASGGALKADVPMVQLSNGYSIHAQHEDEEIRGMVMNPVSIDKDISRLYQWTGRFNPRPNFRYYCDREGASRADAARIQKVLRSTQSRPRLIYIAGHTLSLDRKPPTESCRDLLAYAPADYLNTLPSGQPNLIPYSTMRQSLLKDPRSGPLLFITEVCFCDNFLGLPYTLECDGSEVQWKETEYQGTFTGTSSEIVHIAATTPGESALSFTTGAVFTQALHGIDPSQKLSLKQIAKRLQENVNTILPAGRSQRPKIYCSSKIDGPHFFAALGFCASNVGMGVDSDLSE